MLTIVTPVLCVSKNDYLYTRILWFIENSFTSQDVKRIIVDYASPEHISTEFKKLCQKNGIVFIELKKYGHLFSAGECRNIGVSLARTPYITFQDVDLYAPESIYQRILNKLKQSTFYNDLCTVPCLYLSESFSEQFSQGKSEEEYDSLFKTAYNFYLESDKNIQMYAPVTSMVLVRREYFMEVGGNNLEFQGHGYEDFESLHRLASLSNRFVKPIDYYNHEHKYHSISYEGYRTYFSLFGRTLMDEGLFFVHLWHPKNISNAYTSRNHINKALFERRMRSFDKEGWLPEVLNDIDLNEKEPKTLILAPKYGKTVASIRNSIPYLGSVLYSHDKDFNSVESFERYLQENKVGRVLFFNSYGNEFRHSLYKYCENNQIKTINFDRGALPDSWFFDPKGFNYASDSYNSNNWDKPLTKNLSEVIEKYINDILVSDNELEKNGLRVGGYAFRRRYNFTKEKILFVPLQRPNDSVIRYFSDNVESIDSFIKSVVLLADKLSENGWIVCLKQHPLEPNLSKSFSQKNIRVLKESDNFKDILSVSDAVLTINSGVGLYSLMFGKPTFTVGNAFYAHEGLSVKIKDVDELTDKLFELNKYSPDTEKVRKFIYYLSNEFYSFGKTIYATEINKHTNSSTRVARYIDFTLLRVPDFMGEMVEHTLTRRIEPASIDTPYYNYYRSWFGLRNKLNKDKKENENKDKYISELKLQIARLKLVESDNKDSGSALLVDKTAVLTKASKNDFSRKSRKWKKFCKTPGLFLQDAYKNFKMRLINR